MISDDELIMWTIYDHPPTYPNNFVAVAMLITAAGPVTTGDLMIAPRINMLRDELHRRGLVMMVEDPPVDNIVETWF